jgi:hypothetical protein
MIASVKINHFGKKIGGLLLLLPIFCWGFQSASIEKFTPSTGKAGTVVTIYGTALSWIDAVKINTTYAIVLSKSNEKLVVLVMPGTTSGKLQLLAAHQTIPTSAVFVVQSDVAAFDSKGQKLVGTGSVGNACQGYAVALSADGATAVVGARHDDNNQGSVWVYNRRGQLWQQQGNKLVGSGAISFAQQGEAVSISADGNTIVVGGPADNDKKGAVWVFVKLGNSWLQQAKLVGLGSIGNVVYFGNAVALSADGNTVVVGGYWDDGGKGAVWVFERQGSLWVQRGNKLLGNDMVGAAKFGKSVAISAAGTSLIAGGWDDSGSKGAAWVYSLQQQNWLQQGQKLVAFDALGNAKQGTAVSMSADGETVMIGGYADNNNQGAAWIFTKQQLGWVQQGNKLVGSGSLPFSGLVFQGFSVSLSADASTAVLGGYYDASAKGAVWVFHYLDGKWVQATEKITAIGSIDNSYLGWAIQLSSDGKHLISGGIFDNGGKGAAWVYQINELPKHIHLFTKENAGGGLDIGWIANVESSTDFFHVLHSSNKNNEWSVIGKVNASHNAENRYEFIHQTPDHGVNYYRIQQFFTSGHSTYSPINSIRIKREVNEMKVYPIPVQNHIINIALKHPPIKALQYKICDVNGRILQAGIIKEKQSKLPLDQSEKGIYFLYVDGLLPVTLSIL